MTRRSLFCAILLVTVSTFYGCATVIAGYENKVMLLDLPPETKVYDTDAIELTLHTKKEKRLARRADGVDRDSIFTVGPYIFLRSNADHLLTFRNASGEKRVHLYPKLSAGWFILDLLTLTFPIDLYTGNWNHFDDIQYSKIQ